MRHLISALLFVSASAFAASQAPSFERFPAKAALTKPLVGPNLSSPQARKFRSVLRAAAKGQPNFAGHFSVAFWGCGVACYSWAVIDRHSGKVWFSPFTVNGAAPSYCEKVESYCSPELEFRPKSELLIIKGARNAEGAGQYYYRWHNGKLSLVYAEELRR
jgi:hypothetical protein